MFLLHWVPILPAIIVSIGARPFHDYAAWGGKRERLVSLSVAGKLFRSFTDATTDRHGEIDRNLVLISLCGNSINSLIERSKLENSVCFSLSLTQTLLQ